VVVGRIVGAIAVLLLIVWLCRKVVKSEVWRRVADRFRRRKNVSIVEFYDRMLQILATKGFVRQPHQTPLEFALAVGLPEARVLSMKYNEVRYGRHELSPSEELEVEEALAKIARRDQLSKQEIDT